MHLYIFTLGPLYHTWHINVLSTCTQTKDGYRLDFCEVVDTFGYATRDVFAALTEAADFVNIATATTSNIDIKDEL